MANDPVDGKTSNPKPTYWPPYGCVWDEIEIEIEESRISELPNPFGTPVAGVARTGPQHQSYPPIQVDHVFSRTWPADTDD